MELRELGLSEAGELHRTMRECFDSFAASEPRLREILPTLNALGLFEAGRLIGFALGRGEGDAFRASDISILPSYRAWATVEAALGMFKTWARERGYDRLLAETCERDLIGLSFFIRAGFASKNKTGEAGRLELEANLGRRQ